MTMRYHFILACVFATVIGAAEIQGCPIYPADNAWNRDISNDPVHAKSADYLASILTGKNKFLHADFGSNLDYGIPFVVVSGNQAKVPIDIVEFPDESDPGPFPIPLDAPVEADSDAHVSVLDKDNKILYELYHAVKKGSGWQCGCSAKFDLTSNALRTDGFTSADAAGLPILPGLAKYDEAASGVIDHALRFTVHATQAGYIHPATHKAGTADPTLPPMGLRLRLKKDFDLSAFTGKSLVILTALKKYGMFVADNGSDWYISGASDVRWDDDDLNQLKTVPGSAFEAVDTGPILGTNGGGSDPNPNPNPNPNPDPTPPLTPLTSPSLKITLDFNKGRDQIALTTLLDGVTALSDSMMVNVGGVQQMFTLGKNGKGVAGKSTASLKVSKNGGPAKVQVKLNGTFASMLAGSGLTQDGATTNPTVRVSVSVSGGNYGGNLSLGYQVKRGKGMARN